MMTLYPFILAILLFFLGSLLFVVLRSRRQARLVTCVLLLALGFYEVFLFANGYISQVSNASGIAANLPAGISVWIEDYDASLYWNSVGIMFGVLTVIVGIVGLFLPRLIKKANQLLIRLQH
jgi:hypothetical protein